MIDHVRSQRDPIEMRNWESSFNTQAIGAGELRHLISSAATNGSVTRGQAGMGPRPFVCAPTDGRKPEWRAAYKYLACRMARTEGVYARRRRPG